MNLQVKFLSETIKMVLAQPQNQHVTKAFDLTGKVAVITGTSTLNPARATANSRLQVVLVESDSKYLEDWQKPVPTYGHPPLPYHNELTKQ